MDALQMTLPSVWMYHNTVYIVHRKYIAKPFLSPRYNKSGSATHLQGQGLWINWQFAEPTQFTQSSICGKGNESDFVTGFTLWKYVKQKQGILFDFGASKHGKDQLGDTWENILEEKLEPAK